jgi:hypothetical protein
LEETVERASEELSKDAWATYFTELSRGHPGVEISIEILGGEIGRGIEASSLRFEDLVYDQRNDVLEVAGSTQAGASRQVLRHFVSGPQRIWVERRSGLPNAIEIDDAEGLKTLVTFRAPAAS